MKELFLSLWIVLLTFCNGSAQDTIYFDTDWFVCEKANAKQYTTINQVLNKAGNFVVKDFTIDGVLLSTYNYKALQAEINWNRIYEIGFHDYAVEHGISIEYYPGGSKKRRLKYIDGKQEGEIVVWSERGSKLREFVASNNLATGKYVEYFESGETKFQVNFRNDTLHGQAMYFHPNGKLSQTGEFKNGHKFGKWKYYTEEGAFISEENYKANFYISGPNLKLTFPVGLWYLSESYNEDGRMNFLFYRIPAIDSKNDADRASCLIRLEALQNGTELIDYSSFRRRSLPVEVKRVITAEKKLFTLPKTIGYFGNSLGADKEERRVVFLHSIQNNVGVEIIMDCSVADYEKLRNEFKFIVKSLRK